MNAIGTAAGNITATTNASITFVITTAKSINGDAPPKRKSIYFLYNMINNHFFIDKSLPPLLLRRALIDTGLPIIPPLHGNEHDDDAILNHISFVSK